MSPGKIVDPKKRKGYSGKKIPAFSQNVRERRLELGLKQSELAEALGISTSRISTIEGGGFVEDPDRVWQLADALKTTCDKLLRPSDSK